MAIGIIGLSQSGKTTIFNAVTRGHAETGGFRASGAQPHIGVAKVPDSRLDVLSAMHNSRRIVPAEIEYVDIPGMPEGLGRNQGISGEFLNMLQRCDALLEVVRAFENPAVPTPEGQVDQYRDVATLEVEMAVADLGILERRAQRIQERLKGAKPVERDLLGKEIELIQRIHEQLEAEVPVREQELPLEANELISNFQLLTAKPLIVVFNLGEDDVARRAAIEEEMRQRIVGQHTAVASLCGTLEMELDRLSVDEEAAFRAELEAGESGLKTMVLLTYQVLGLITFLTTGEDESRAWTIIQGTPAVRAAAKIHSDIERGFIRAEVIAYDALERAGSEVEARRQGVLRSEGKQYVVRDGDVINFLFNV